MENMFKRSILGVAISAAALASVAVQAKPATDTIDMYGQIAVSVWQFGEDEIANGEQPLNFENESRFGLRGTKELARGPNIFWQLEGGNVGDDGSNSGLGVRDTFIGFDFEDAGKLRVGRLLTPLYEVIDWPYSGQRAGAVFDWGGDVIGGARYDRQSNMVRYDSANLGGFNFNIAAGRGTESNSDSNFYGAAAHFTTGAFTLHGGVESGQDRAVSAASDLYSQWLLQQPGNPPKFDSDKVEGATTSDTLAYLVGFEVALGDFGFNAAYKQEEADYADTTITVDGDEVAISNLDIEQASYSVGLVYSGVEDWQFKANYAANLDAEVNGSKVSNTEDAIISVQALYFLDDSALAYVRPYVIEQNGSDSEFGWGAGFEYYF